MALKRRRSFMGTETQPVRVSPSVMSQFDRIAGFVALMLAMVLAIGSTGCSESLARVADDGVDTKAAKPTGNDASQAPIADKEIAGRLPHPFPRRAPAPRLTGGTAWLNTENPVDLKDLRGKFVLLDFWTYCCINCMHVLPELKKLEQKYPNELVVIGVHSGKFDTERDADSIRQAIMRHEIEHPVVNDADQKIWERYQCRSWPSLRLIDPEGNWVANHSGEIDFETLDEVLQQVLPYYRQQELLNEKPLSFRLERDKADATPLRYPGKILADEPGNRLFISDSNHNRIIITTLDGQVQTIIGEGTAGKRDGDFQSAQFDHPQGMALHGDTLYVADTENHLLRKIDLKQQSVATIAGTGQQGRSPWLGIDPEAILPRLPDRFVGPPKTTALNSPWALWIDENRLYIAMAGYHQIWSMPLDESEIGPYAGNGREDIVDGPLLPGTPYGANYASFAQPSGLSSDGKSLFVADSEGSSIRSVPLAKKTLDDNATVSTIVGTAHLPFARLFTFGDADGDERAAKLQHCLDVVYHDGKLYVADTYNHKIKQIDLKTKQVKTLVGTGKPGHDDSDSTTSGTLFEPAGLAYAAGKLYIADTNNHVIRTFDLKSGNLVTLEFPSLSAPASARPTGGMPPTKG